MTKFDLSLSTSLPPPDNVVFAASLNAVKLPASCE